MQFTLMALNGIDRNGISGLSTVKVSQWNIKCKMNPISILPTEVDKVVSRFN